MDDSKFQKLLRQLHLSLDTTEENDFLFDGNACYKYTQSKYRYVNTWEK